MLGGIGGIGGIPLTLPDVSPPSAAFARGRSRAVSQDSLTLLV